MSQFIAIAGIHLEHDYYTPPVNSYLSLGLTPRTRELIKQRGVMFKQVAPNEWQWLKEEKNTGFMVDDVIEVSIIVADPDFMRKIATKNYDPQKLYQISLGRETVVINEEFNLLPVSVGTKHRGEFCRVMLKPAQIVKLPEQIYTIRFCTSSYYWEFLFVFKDKTDPRGKFIVLETTQKNRIVFHPPKKYEYSTLGSNVYRIVSMEKIKARGYYEFTLILYDNSPGSGGRRVVSRFIPIPQPGRHITDNPDIIREVYYL